MAQDSLKYHLPADNQKPKYKLPVEKGIETQQAFKPRDKIPRTPLLQ